jgi:ABC-2 type transport system ATP-binding protein
MISCRNLTRWFGANLAVQGVSFELVDGAICALLGPNGAGKSTILAMLSGLILPSEGEARVANVEVTPGSIELRRRIGVLPEGLGLFEDLTVEEHLLLTADVYGVERAEAHERVNKLLRLLDLEHGRNAFASECSHGMRKKTAISMALLPQPKVLLLDEPFEGIDPVTAKLIQRTLQQISERGVTTLMATHVLASVDQVATDVLILRNGSIVWRAAGSELNEPLETTYLKHIGHREEEELPWLGSQPS